VLLGFVLVVDVPEPEPELELDGADEPDELEELDEPLPIAPKSWPIVLCRSIGGPEPEDDDPALDCAPPAELDAGAVVLVAAVEADPFAARLVVLAAVDAEDDVHPVSTGWAPAGAYGGSPPGSGGHTPGLDGSGELMPGCVGPSQE
jgi:hypothetical protein